MASFAQVQAILHRDWDPIGCGVPLDEYDAYAWPVLKLLQAGAAPTELEDYLRKTAREAMSCSVPEARLQLVVNRLLELKDA
jgi:hypothetical protein